MDMMGGGNICNISRYTGTLDNYSTPIGEIRFKPYRKKFVLYKNGTYDMIVHDDIYVNSIPVRTIKEISNYKCKYNIKYCSRNMGRFY